MRYITKSLATSPSGRKAGFTLAEMLISLLFLSLIIIGTLTLIDTSNRVALGQINRSDMQQSARVTQRDIISKMRMLGRGGLPASIPESSVVLPNGTRLPDGLAIKVENNVSNFTVGPNDVVDGTDVLRLRGVFSTPLYIVNHTDENNFEYDAAQKRGFVQIYGLTPIGQVVQDLSPLIEAFAPTDPSANTVREALVLTSPFDERVWAVVELDTDTSSVVVDAAGIPTVRIGFKTGNTTNSTEMVKMSTKGEFPIDQLPGVGTIAILEELVYYVRDEATGPKLTRAEVFPGTNEPYRGNAANWDIDIAENVIDLQVSLGFDLDGDGQVMDGANGENDEWLLNAPFTPDDPTAGAWLASLSDPNLKLMYMRLVTLTQSEQPEPGHLSPLIVSLEDRDYRDDPINDPTSAPEYEGNRLYHREVLRTTIDLRNM